MKNRGTAWVSFAPRVLCLFILSSCTTATSPPKTLRSRPVIVQKTVAVLDFVESSFPSRPETHFWRQGLANLLIADLRLSDSLKVLERHHLAAILREQELSASTLADPATQLRADQIRGVDFLIVGHYIIIGDTVELTARMINVETGGDKGEKVGGKLAEMRSLSRQLSIELLRTFDEKIAAREQEKLAMSKDLPLEAVRHFSTGLDYESLGQYRQAEEEYIKALSISPEYHEAKERLEWVSLKAAQQ